MWPNSTENSKYEKKTVDFWRAPHVHIQLRFRMLIVRFWHSTLKKTNRCQTMTRQHSRLSEAVILAKNNQTLNNLPSSMTTQAESSIFKTEDWWSPVGWCQVFVPENFDFGSGRPIRWTASACAWWLPQKTFRKSGSCWSSSVFLAHFGFYLRMKVVYGNLILATCFPLLISFSFFRFFGAEEREPNGGSPRRYFFRYCGQAVHFRWSFLFFELAASEKKW